MSSVAKSTAPEVDQDSPGAALRLISNRLTALAEQIDGNQPVSETALSRAMAERDELLLRIWAESEYASRRKRLQWLPAQLLGEPTWDILLELYIKSARGKRVPPAQACLASMVPAGEIGRASCREIVVVVTVAGG